MKSATTIATLTGLVSLASALPQVFPSTTTTSSTSSTSSSSTSSSSSSSSSSSTSSSSFSTTTTATNGFPFQALPFGGNFLSSSTTSNFLSVSTNAAFNAAVTGSSTSSPTTPTGFPFAQLPFGNLLANPASNVNNNNNNNNAFANFNTNSNSAFGVPAGTNAFAGTNSFASGPGSSIFAPPVAGQNAAAPASAIYVQSNTNNNTVIAYPVGSNGTIIGNGVQYMTNGNGGRANTTSTPVPDALLSQGALQVVGNYLLAVNAGSGTMTMFQINCQNPTQLNMVGQPVSTLGDWPNTIAASMNLQMACVGNTGTRSGVACFSITSTGLIPLDNTQRNVALTPVQSNPPRGPPNTFSSLQFNAAENALILAVKGNPAAPGRPAPGFFNVYAVSNATVSQTPVRSSPNGTMGPFGFVSLANNQLLITDAIAGSLDLFQLNTTNLTLTRLSRSTSSQSRGLCWIAGNAVSGNAYTTAFQDFTVAADPLSGNLTQATNFTDGNANLAQISAAADKIYALSFGTQTQPPMLSVSRVLNSQGGLQELQNFNLSAGMASNLTFNIDGLAVMYNDGTCQLNQQVGSSSSAGAASFLGSATSTSGSSTSFSQSFATATSTGTTTTGASASFTSLGGNFFSTPTTGASASFTSLGGNFFSTPTTGAGASFTGLGNFFSTPTNGPAASFPGQGNFFSSPTTFNTAFPSFTALGNSFSAATAPNNAGSPPIAVGVPIQSQKVKRAYELVAPAEQ